MTTLHPRSKCAGGLALLACGLLAAGCSSDKGAARRRGGKVPVKVARVQQKPMPLDLRAIGTVEPYRTVSVRSQVSGLLEKVDFTEGQEVQKGQLLFEIDPRPFQAALAQAEQKLAGDRADQKTAQAQLDRYAKLVKKGFVTQQAYDDAKAKASSLSAAVAGDKSAVSAARLDLQYCSLRAPIAGRTGAVLVHIGNVVKALDTQPLVVINQVKPIRVRFAVPEPSLPRVRAHAHDHLPVKVTPGQTDAALEDAPGIAPATGVLSFIDNTVDADTGTILLKADFPNGDEQLWPGEYVNVDLLLGQDDKAVVVPTAAVQSSQKGTFVFVVNSDGTVSSRSVTVARSDDREAVIAKGVKPGETVVTDGQMRLRPGVHVQVMGSAAAGSEARR